MAESALIDITLGKIGKVITDVNTAKEKVKLLKKELRGTKDAAKAEELAKEIAGASQEVRKLTAEQKKLNKELDNMGKAAKVEPVEGSYNKLEQTIKETEAQMKSLNLTTAKGQAEWDKLSASVIESKKKLSGLNQSFKEQKQSVAEVPGSYRAMTSELKRLEDKLSRLPRDTNKAKKEFSETRQRVLELKRETEKYRKSLSLTQNKVKAVPGSYRAMQQEINRLSNSLRKMSIGQNATRKEFTLTQRRIQHLRKEMSGFDRKISASGTLVADYGMGFKQAFMSMPPQIMAAQAAMQLLQGTVRAVGEEVGTFFELEKGFAKVNTVAQLSTEEIKKFRDDALKAAGDADFAGDIKNIDDAMFNLRSGTSSTTEALDLYEKSLVAAQAGQVDLTAAADAGLATYGAVKEQVAGAGEVFDGLFAIARAGRTDFQKTASDFPKVAAQANSMGLSFLEAGAGYASLTRALSSEESATSLNALLRDLADPKKQKRIEKYADVFDPITGNIRPLVDIVGDLGQAFEGLNDQQRAQAEGSLKLNARSKKAFDILSASMDDYRQINDDIVNGAGGEMDRQLEKSSNTTDRFNAAVNKLKIGFQLFMAQMANDSAPMVESIIDMGKSILALGSAYDKFLESIGAGDVGIISGTFKALAWTIETFLTDPINRFTTQISEFFQSIGSFVNVAKIAFKGMGEVAGVSMSAMADGMKALISLDFDGVKEAMNRGKAAWAKYESGLFTGKASGGATELVSKNFDKLEDEIKKRVPDLNKEVKKVKKITLLDPEKTQKEVNAHKAALIEMLADAKKTADAARKYTNKATGAVDATFQKSIDAHQAKALKTRRTLVDLTKNAIELTASLEDQALIDSKLKKDKFLADLDTGLQYFAEFAPKINSILSEALLNVSSQRVAAFDDGISETETNISELEEKKNELIAADDERNEAATLRQIARIEKEIDAEEKALEQSNKNKAEAERKYAKDQAISKIISAGIDTAAAVIKALAVSPSPNIPAALLAGSLGALQIGIMTAEAAKLEGGGYLPNDRGILKGPRHSGKGIPFSIGNKRYEAEGGEFINNRQSTAQNSGILRTINEDKGRTRFALIPDIPTPVIPQQKVAIAQAQAAQTGRLNPFNTPQSKKAKTALSVTLTQNEVTRGNQVKTFIDSHEL